MIDFNTEPYNDDFDEDKKFYRILFRPSFAVQARELTQLQTILQKQIERHGNAIFKQGAMVIPGQASVETITDQNNGSDYVKLQALYSGVAVETFISSLEGATIIGSSGVTAQIVKVQNLEQTEPTTIYVRYTNSGTNGTTKTFSNSEVITTEDGTYSFQALATDAIGKGSLATIQRGVYYVNGHFCLVDKQTIVLDKYSNTPSYRIGLLVTESTVTPEEDETLLDNAQNSFNFAAPGAHRYSIDLTLTKRGITSTDDEDFIELIRVVDGRIKTIVDTTEYSLLGKELARRTYDESGDYTVREFPIDIREHRNNNRGAWTQNTAYLIGDIVTNAGKFYFAKNSGTSVTTAPTHTSGTAFDGPGSTGIRWEYTETPQYNRGIHLDGSESKLAIGLEPGKAYVRGFEIEKDSTTYIAVDKARDYNQATNAIIPATVGNYVLVTNVNNAPPIDTLERVTLYNRVTGSSRGAIPSGAQIVGTARVRFMEWNDGLPFGNSSVYKLGLFDVQLNSGFDFNRDVKAFWAAATSGSTDTNLAFSADISPIVTPLIGSVTASGTTVTGTGTSFQTDLRAGDFISVNGALYRVDSITSQTSLTLSTSLTATGAAFGIVSTTIQEPGNTSLIFPLPYYAVRSIRRDGNPAINTWPALASSGINDLTYRVYQKFTVNATGTTAVISTSGTFDSAAETDNYICIDNDADNGGAVFTPSSIVVTGSTATINGCPGSGRSITVIASVIRNGAGFEKTKTLTTATPMTFTTAATAQEPTLLLEHADVFRIISIKMAPGSAFGTTPAASAYTVDISDRYDFDNGQRSTHYDLSRLVLKPSYSAPSNPIRIEYEYFEHGTGDYFDVNSYTGIDYKQIPTNLRDAIDFRPRVANKSAGTTRNFIGTGASVTGVPKRGVDIEADFTYYLARTDKIALDFNGVFSSIKGVPSLNPGAPEDPALGMILYTLNLEPYTFTSLGSSVQVEKVENKRYTMRDIGKLEKRIDNLEYYTSLSLLETETQSLKIQDDVGLDRLKNGFIVDNFTGNNIANSRSEDYFCSIDMQKGELRPFYTMNNVNLLEKNSNTAQRTASNYQLNGDIITLPIIDNPVLIKQDYASRLENINPFAIFTFLGNVQINPPSDDWFETERLPDIVQQVEGNFNLLKDLYERSGVLGTVWNAWQTEWVGQSTTERGFFTTGGAWANQRALNQGATYLSVAEFNARFGTAGGGGPARQVVTETTATEVGQSRSGIKTNFVAKTDYETVSDRTVSTAIIPFIRSRNILVQSKGLKPSTRFWAYFDDVDISSYITPCRKMVYTLNSGTFDDSTNVGGSASETKRRINGDSQVCLNRGDVISNALNTASAVVVGKTVDPDTGALTLELANVIGTFTTGQTFTGSISGAIGTVVSITTPTTLVTNKNGDLNFIFNIPNTEAVRFRTGSRELKLIDSNTATGQWTSRGRGTYRAQGVLETKQATVNAVRNGELVREAVTQEQTIFQTSERVVSDTGWYDPLAQSFLVQQKGGAFITKIDVFFATKDPSIPVTLELREMVNGTPGKTVLPFSRVTLKPEQVNLSTNTVSLDGTLYPTFDTPTTFTFPTPVYVQDNGEYCFVLLSDSNNYRVWISQVGDNIPGTSRTISEQPYNGVMFKSQNASTWTADQNQDIKFTIYRAKFNTAAVGNVEFVNDVLPYYNLEKDPFQTVTGTNTVRVWHYDHGMTVGSRVNITGATGTINGIPSAELNGEKVISNVDLNSYTITSTTNATITGYGGGSAIRATRNVQYDAVNPTVQMQTFSDTTTSFSIKTTSGRSVDGGETAYVQDTGFTPCLNKENNYFLTPRMIASEINENTSLAGDKSLTFSVVMRSSNDSLSPVIDTARASLIAISNKVNSPTESNINVAALDVKTVFTHTTGAFNFANVGSLWTATTSLTANAFVYFGSNLYQVIVAGTTGSAAPTHTQGDAVNGTTTLRFAGNPGTITSTNAAVRAAMPSIGIGRFVTISGATNAGNNGTFLVTGYRDDGTTGTLTFQTVFTAAASNAGATVQLRELFVDEIAPVGSSTASKYVTQPVKLANISTFTRIRFAANIPNGSDVQVYYKTCVGDSKQLDNTKYTLATPDSALVKVENGNETFFDVDYSIENMIPFDTIVIKIALKSTNSAAVPRIKDLRVIACA